MKTLKFSCIMLGLMLPVLRCQPAPGDDLGEAVQAAIRKVEPSIVRLRVIGGEQSIDGDAVSSLVTTGIVISEDGEILTSQFALEGNPEAVLVEDQSGKRTNATVVATDSVRRIVLLKAKEGRWAPAVADEHSAVEVGQWSIALGRFYAAESSSVSVGIISALNRIHGMAIQTDAKVSPVNYGGPLVSLNGSIVGILVPLSPRGGGGSATSGIEWYDSGIGFAIPLKDALASAAKLRSGQNLKPGRIGIRLVPTGAFDTQVVVDRVSPGSPAELAGLLKGDRILAIDGQAVERSSILMESLARHYAGDSVVLKIRRGEADISATVELAESLPRAAQGYLGLLPIRLARQAAAEVPADEKAKDGQQPPLDIPRIKLPEILQKNAGAGKDDSDSVPLIVVNGAPTAEKDVPAGIEVLSLNAARTTSLAELAIAVDELVPGSVAKIEYRVPGETKTQTAEITAVSRPESVIALSEVVLNQIQHSRPSSGAKAAVPVAADTNGDPADKPAVASTTNGVARREFNFEERGRCVVLSSSDASPVMPGIIILLSADQSSEEDIVRHWGPVLKSHCLTVAIPQNPESARLTTDDIPLVLTTIRALVSQAGADLRRVVVVADRPQSSLAWQCTFGGPSTIRGIALTDGWFSGADIQGVEGAGHSVLLLDSASGAQAKALRELSRKSLTDAGFWAPFPTAADENNETKDDADAAKSRAVQCIADWSLLMRSF
ncbi:MAG: serine protease [Fuerstia sp.]|nr:serine protease [Fuerstiella sp.]